MSATAIASLIGYMLACSFTPGPGNILALNTTSTFGWRRSRHLIFGIVWGMPRCRQFVLWHCII